MKSVKTNSKTRGYKQSKVKKKTLRILLFGVPSIIVMVYFFTYAFNMSLEIVSKYDEKEELEQDLNDLKEKEQELSTDVLKLQDPEYVGRYLREKYYYSKNNEYIIKLPNKN